MEDSNDQDLILEEGEVDPGKLLTYAELQTNEYKQVIIVDEENDITLNKLTIYEVAQLVVAGINRLNKGFPSTLSQDELYIDVADVNILSNPQGNIKTETIDGEERIKLTSTVDIAKREINMNKSPFLVHRVLLDTGNYCYVVLKNPNKMIKPVL